MRNLVWTSQIIYQTISHILWHPPQKSSKSFEMFITSTQQKIISIIKSHLLFSRTVRPYRDHPPIKNSVSFATGCPKSSTNESHFWTVAVRWRGISLDFFYFLCVHYIEFWNTNLFTYQNVSFVNLKRIRQIMIPHSSILLR